MSEDDLNRNIGEPEFRSEESDTDIDTDTLTANSGDLVPTTGIRAARVPWGPPLMDDHHSLEKMAQFDRERIPERTVHAKGGGAYGTFTVTNGATAA